LPPIAPKSAAWTRAQVFMVLEHRFQRHESLCATNVRGVLQ
jgi:hypothetical protein